MQFGFHLGVIEEVRAHDLAQLGMSQCQLRAADGQNFIDIFGQQALAQHALPDHATATQKDDLHR
ncbi:TPA: hypothetical protein ACOEBE_003984 [Stenotrophomonas maltophilia]